MTLLRGILPSLLLLFLAAACSERPASAETSTSTAPAALTTTPIVADYYTARCAVCHGANGGGDGAAAAALSPKPRAFRDPAALAALDDAALRKVIVSGGAAVGKSSAMPAFADLGEKPEELERLIRQVRAMAKP